MANDILWYLSLLTYNDLLGDEEDGLEYLTVDKGPVHAASLHIRSYNAQMFTLCHVTSGGSSN